MTSKTSPARLVMLDDYAEVRRMAAEGAAATEPGLGFNSKAFGETFASALRGREYTMFVTDAPHGLSGFLLCRVEGFTFSSGVAARLLAIWVSPEHRGSRAAASLLDSFFEWSRTVRARKTYISIDNNPNPASAARLMARYGARPVGVSMAV